MFALVFASVATAAVAFHSEARMAIDLVPSTDDIVIRLFIQPSAAQRANLFDLAGRFPSLRDPAQLQERMNAAIDGLLGDSGLTHDDVTSWLGPEVVVAVDESASSPESGSVTFLTNADDLALADRTLRQGLPAAADVPHSGFTVHQGSRWSWVILDGVVALSSKTKALFDIMDTAEGSRGGLSTDPTYVDAMAHVRSDALVVGFVNPSSLLGDLESEPFVDGFAAVTGLQALDAVQGVGLSISALPQGISLDASARFDRSKLSADDLNVLGAPAHENPLLAYVPQGAIVVTARQQVDVPFRRILERAASSGQEATLIAKAGIRSAIDALTGDAVLEASLGSSGGAGGAGGALIFGITDPAPIERTLDFFADYYVRQQTPSAEQRKSFQKYHVEPPAPPVWHERNYRGVSIEFTTGGGSGAAYAVTNDAVLVGYGKADLERVIDAKSDGPSVVSSPSFASATAQLGGRESLLFYDIGALIDSPIATDLGLLPSDVADIRPVRTLVIGSSSDLQGESVRVFVTIEKE